MARSYVRVSTDGTGKKVATDEVTDGSDVVERQITRTAGDSPEQLQAVLNAPPAADAYGAVVRAIGGASEATALLELAKLTSIADNTDGLETLITALNTFVDGLETALATLNAKAFLTDAELRLTPVPVSGTVTANAGTNLNTSALATTAKQDALLTELQLKADLTETQPVSATDLDIRNLVQTQDAVAIYGSDDGGTTKRVIKTDAGGAIQVDLEVASVTVSSGSVTADTELTTADLDTGAGTDTRAVVGLVGSASGGGQLIPGDAANGLDVDVTRLPALPAGTANIGDVDVLTVPADPFGANADAAVAAGAVGSIQAKLRRMTTDLDALKTELQLKADLTETQPVSLASIPFVSAPAAVNRASVTGATSSTQLIGAVAARRTLSIFNDSTADLYVNLDGTAASTSNFSVKIRPGGFYESVDRIVGAVFGIWSAVNGAARITETA